jgi:hypothetical protein
MLYDSQGRFYGGATFYHLQFPEYDIVFEVVV